MTATSPTAPLPISFKIVDTSTEQPMSPQALTSSSTSSTPSTDSLPVRQTKTILKELEELLKAHTITSTESQQWHLYRLLTNLEKLSTFKAPIPPQGKAEMFIDLQEFLNGEHNRLGQTFARTPEQCLELQQQYHQLLIFFDALTGLTLFPTDQIEKLKCYHVSMLIGASNIACMRRDNVTKKGYLEQALSIILNIGKDIPDPYRTGQSFVVKIMFSICRKKLQITKLYMQYAQKQK